MDTLRCKFIIPGIVKPKQSTNFKQYGGKRWTYTDKDKVNYQAKVACIARQEWDIPPIDRPVKATIIAYFTRPKNHYRKNGEYSKAGLAEPLWCMKNKDFDNIGKSLADPLHGIVYDNDKQIVFAQVIKLWDNQRFGERVEIIIETIDHVEEFIHE